LHEHWDWRVANGGPETGSYPMQGLWNCMGSSRLGTPQQRDGVSCGIFALAIATLVIMQIPQFYFTHAMVPRMRLHVANCILHQICPLPWCMDDRGNRIGLYLAGNDQRQYRQRLRRGHHITTDMRNEISAAQRLGRYVELEMESTNQSPTTNFEYRSTSTTSRMEQGTHQQAQGPDIIIDLTEAGMTTRQLLQQPLRLTATRARGIRAVTLSLIDVAISGVEPPLEEGSPDDDLNTRRRVDDGADNGRSSSPDIGGREAGSGHNSDYYTMEFPHKRRRLRERETAAPEATDTGAETTSRASSSCSIDVDVFSECNIDHDAQIRTGTRRRLGRGDAPETR